jgi:hypothetical protein
MLSLAYMGAAEIFCSPPTIAEGGVSTGLIEPAARND